MEEQQLWVISSSPLEQQRRRETLSIRGRMATEAKLSLTNWGGGRQEGVAQSPVKLHRDRRELRLNLFVFCPQFVGNWKAFNMLTPPLGE